MKPKAVTRAALLSLLARSEATVNPPWGSTGPPPEVPGAANRMGVKTCNGPKCEIDASGFNMKENVANIKFDFGPEKQFDCTHLLIGGDEMWHGECKGVGKAGVGGTANIIARGKNERDEDQLFGSVNVNGEICQVNPDAAGVVHVSCLPESAYPDEGDPEEELEDIPVVSQGGDATEGFRKLVTNPVDEQFEQTANQSFTRLRGSTGENHRGLVDDLGGNLDVMVVWTSKAECRNSGLAAGCTLTSTTENNIRGMIDLAVAETNAAYTASGVTTQLRLVYAYRDPTYVEASYNAFSQALSQIRSTSDGIMDDVHGKRTQYGADIVAMIIDDGQYCGMAYLGPSIEKMFSVTAWNCATGYYSFGHEIGHNQGCNHDRGSTNACTETNYNYGWRDPAADFRSILAYNCYSGQCDNNAGGGCTRVQRFSNPNFQYNGKAMGTSQHDNARRINDVKATIAAYYPVTSVCTGLFGLTLQTDNYGSETSWTVKDSNDVTHASGFGYESNRVYNVNRCIPSNACTFQINDSYGDGICCGYGQGYYDITMNGVTVVTGRGEFGSSDTVNLCATPPTAPPTRLPTNAPTKAPTPTPVTDIVTLSAGQVLQVNMNGDTKKLIIRIIDGDFVVDYH